MRKIHIITSFLLSGALAAGACGKPDPDQNDGGETSTAGDGDVDTTTSSGNDEATTTAGDGDGDGDGDSTSFVPGEEGDDGVCGGAAMCDIFKDGECGDGFKCTSVACEVGSTSWDSTRCIEMMGSKSIGDECQFFGSGVDGLDDCDEGSMCWDADADTGLGTCVAFCEGSLDMPTCLAGNTVCSVFNEGALPLCLPNCDPLAQDCDNGNLCIPSNSEAGYVCVLDASGGMGPYGTPCMYANSCNAGLLCITPEAVPEPDCASASGCCSPYCDLDAANACPGTGQQCEALYEEGMAPPGYENVGICAVPTG